MIRRISKYEHLWLESTNENGRYEDKWLAKWAGKNQTIYYYCEIKTISREEAIELFKKYHGELYLNEAKFLELSEEEVKKLKESL